MRKVIENKHFKNCKKSNCFIIDSSCVQGDINRYAQSISDIDDYVYCMQIYFRHSSQSNTPF